jgi:hypothetical protein
MTSVFKRGVLAELQAHQLTAPSGSSLFEICITRQTVITKISASGNLQLQRGECNWFARK